MSLRSQIEEIGKSSEIITSELFAAMEEIDPNPEIESLSENCFIVKSSVAFKHSNLSPAFYDWRHTIDGMIAVLTKLRLEDILPKLDEMLAVGSYARVGTYNKLQIHPDLIIILRDIIK